MVTDRASTACLCIVLGALYPQYVAGLCSLIMLDLFSHWYHTSATRTGTHKKSSNWLVNVYYSRKVLFTVCAATELWYMSLYMMHFTPGPALPLPASWGLAPIGLWRAACYASTPLFGFKQLTNVVQLYMACEAMVRSVGEQSGHGAAREASAASQSGVQLGLPFTEPAGATHGSRVAPPLARRDPCAHPGRAPVMLAPSPRCRWKRTRRRESSVEQQPMGSRAKRAAAGSNLTAPSLAKKNVAILLVEVEVGAYYAGFYMEVFRL